MNFEQIHESEINIISQSTRLEGKIQFDHVTRVHGVLVGEVQSREGSQLILSESSVVEGNILADTLLIDGYVRGDIKTSGKVKISRTGRVVGNIQTPKLELEFGAYFEGRCLMNT
jgi:cytoskeletal protein CcmA (bactofilin family)